MCSSSLVCMLDEVTDFLNQMFIRFDVETRHAFVGDNSGQVTMLKLEQDNCNLVTTLKGHTGIYRNTLLLCIYEIPLVKSLVQRRQLSQLHFHIYLMLLFKATYITVLSEQLKA